MKAALFYIFLFVFTNSIAQTNTSAYISPKFKGGKSELFKYAHKYIRYPQFAVQKGIQGLVEATIYINKEGKVKFVNALGKVSEFNAEVKRVLKLSPNWEPGTKNGIPVDTTVIQKVYFSVEHEDQNATKNDISIIQYTEAILDLSLFIETMEERDKKIKLAHKLNEEGSELMKLKKYDEAILKYNEAIKQGGDLNIFLYNRGLAYLNLNQNDNARTDFLEAYRKGDEDAGKIYNDLFK